MQPRDLLSDIRKASECEIALSDTPFKAAAAAHTMNRETELKDLTKEFSHIGRRARWL